MRRPSRAGRRLPACCAAVWARVIDCAAGQPSIRNRPLAAASPSALRPPAGEEAFKEAGPLLPPESEEEDVVTEWEEEARK